ncbi:MAG: ATP synthase F1 subunit epsilon [Flavobacteriales bacterium]|jgi:F-type H+-transporting ATPase subunit epsilon|nr:ATP synthase F1 subunit epsilon [Flavobacteriales bacterium]
MNVEIITPDENLFKGAADSIIVPGTTGLIGILNDHAPFITTLQKGSVVITTAKGEETFDVKGGVVEVLNNNVIVLAE